MKLGYYLNLITQLADRFIPPDIAANREQREKARIFLYSHLFGPFIGTRCPWHVSCLTRRLIIAPSYWPRRSQVFGYSPPCCASSAIIIYCPCYRCKI